MCFSHLGVFLISVKPLTTENTKNKTTPKICKITVMATRSTFQLDRLLAERSILHFPNLMHVSEGILQTLAKLPTGNWTIEEVFCRAVGLDVCCSVRAEQDPRGSWTNVGCLPFDRNKLYSDSWRNEKLLFGYTHRQLMRHGPPRPRLLRTRDP